MSFKREWGIGSWANRASLQYSEIDNPITKNGVDYHCDTYGRIGIHKEAGEPRPLINFDDSTDNIWYMSYESDDFQAVFRVTFTED